MIGSLALINLLALGVFACDSGKTDAKVDAKDAPVVVPGTEARAVVDGKAVAGPGTELPATGKTGAVTAKPEAHAVVATPAAGDHKAVTTKTGAVVDGAAGVAATAPADRVKAAEPDAAPAGDGGSLAQKEGWANYTKELNAKVGQVNTACGSKLSASYDKSTYTDFDPMKDRTEAACKAAVGTLSAICMTDPGKETVRKLTRATCKFSTTGTGASLSGTTLVIKIDPEKSSITGKAAGSYSWASAIKEVL